MANILDQMTDQINKGIKNVTSKSKEFIETAKLRAEVRNTETVIHGKFNALGKKVFEMLNNEALNERSLVEDCSDITSLYKTITDLEERIKKIELETHQTMHGADTIPCSECGTANKVGGKFCGSCGAPIIAVGAAELNSCSACGTAVKKGAKFCTRCGGKMTTL